MMVHREIARKHVPREAYLISRVDDPTTHSVLRFTLHRWLMSPADLGGPCVYLEEVEHSLVDKPVTCDQFLPINRV